MIEFPRRRRIYLLRHGEAAYVTKDGTVTTDPRNVPLTELGAQQAHIQGRSLADIAFDQAICSGLPRTVETATHVLSHSSHPIPRLEKHPHLEEIQGMGKARVWPSRPTEVREILEHIANPWAQGAQPGATFLGGELFADFAQRVSRGWQAILADPNWESLLLVLHGAVNRMIFNLVLNIDWQANLCIEQDNCCINIIDIDDGSPCRYLIRAVNVTNYNASKAGIHRTNMEDTALRIADTLDLST